jgi:hypothetical protein
MRSIVPVRQRTRPAALALALSLALSPALGTARAEEMSYAERAKATILDLLAGRDFKPESGCGQGEACAALLAHLQAGEFAVIEPAQSSDRPDMPIYLAARKKCAGIDPVRIVLAHRTFRATRDFAIYRLDAPRWPRVGESVLVFRAADYLMTGEIGRTAAGGEAPMLLPGSFAAFGLRSCRFLATAPAEDGERFARHNEVAAADHASELIKLGERYLVLNLVPIAGPRQPKATWWYSLGLWDLGLAAPDLRRERHVYTFGYKPVSAGDFSDAEAASSSAG